MIDYILKLFYSKPIPQEEIDKGVKRIKEEIKTFGRPLLYVESEYYWKNKIVKVKVKPTDTKK